MGAMDPNSGPHTRIESIYWQPSLKPLLCSFLIECFFALVFESSLYNLVWVLYWVCHLQTLFSLEIVFSFSNNVFYRKKLIFLWSLTSHFSLKDCTCGVLSKNFFLSSYYGGFFLKLYGFTVYIFRYIKYLELILSKIWNIITLHFLACEYYFLKMQFFITKLVSGLYNIPNICMCIT